MKIIILTLIILFTGSAIAQTFEEIDQGVFVGAQYPSIAIANIDAELNTTPEIIINGNGESSWRTNLYAKDGNGSYQNIESTFLEEIYSMSAVAFADIDNDGDQDLLITSYDTRLFLNNDLGVYTEIATDIANIYQGEIAFFDMDGDGDQDLIITGYNGGEGGSGDPATFLYVNDGNGNFTKDTNSSFESFTNSTVSIADIDGDNDLDLLLTGSIDLLGNFLSLLYTNNGAGIFTEVENTPFEGIYEGVAQGSSAFADIDGDGDQDLFITGRDWQAHPVGKLYTNNGSGIFTEVLNTGLPPVQESAIAFADVDNDNDLDLMITGLSNGPTIGKLYTNNGSGSFTEVADLPFDDFLRSDLQFFDADGDNDLDLIIAGFSITDNTYRTKLYENTTVLGTVNFDLAEKTIIYPNPVQDSFTIQLPEEFANNSISIQFNLYDSIGRKVVSISNFSSENNRIDIQYLENGLYFYELINSSQKIGSGKIIKK